MSDVVSSRSRSYASCACRSSSPRARIFFPQISRSMPTANAEGSCRSEGTRRRISSRPFQCYLGSVLIPSACPDKKNLRSASSAASSFRSPRSDASNSSFSFSSYSGTKDLKQRLRRLFTSTHRGDCCYGYCNDCSDDRLHIGSRPVAHRLNDYHSHSVSTRIDSVIVAPACASPSRHASSRGASARRPPDAARLPWPPPTEVV